MNGVSKFFYKVWPLVANLCNKLSFVSSLYRPIEVVLDINIGDLTVHLIKNCLPKDPPCPFLVVEKLVFEMDKNYRETRLQLQLSPVVLRSSGSEKVDR